MHLLNVKYAPFMSGLRPDVEMEAFGAKWSENDAFQQTARYGTTVPYTGTTVPDLPTPALSASTSIQHKSHQNQGGARPCQPLARPCQPLARPCQVKFSPRSSCFRDRFEHSRALSACTTRSCPSTVVRPRELLSAIFPKMVAYLVNIRESCWSQEGTLEGAI
ncbi:hypothetical protein Hanom_Chr13g01232671 [Helianthus anomalus]